MIDNLKKDCEVLDNGSGDYSIELPMGKHQVKVIH